MERRIARFGGVHVRPALDQVRTHRPISAVGGDDERAGAVRRDIVHVGAGRQQVGRASDVSRAGRKQQRRKAAEIGLRHAPDGVLIAITRVELNRPAPDARPGVDVRSSREQSLDDAIVSARGGPHQGRLPVGRLGDVHVGAPYQQRIDHVECPCPHRDHQRRLAARGRRIRTGARGQQRRRDRRASVLAGKRQGCDAVIVGRVRIGAGRDQPADQGQIVVMRSPVKRGRAVRLGSVDLYLAREQRVDGAGIPPLHGVGEPMVGGARRHAQNRRGQDQPAGSTPCRALSHLHSQALPNQHNISSGARDWELDLPAEARRAKAGLVIQ